VESKRGDKVPKKIDKIYFLGGGFCLKNLIAVISPLVGVACEAFIPIKEEQHKLDLSHAHLDAVLSTPFFSVAEALATCAGLERGGKSNFVNFVPYELKQKELIAAKRIAVSLGMFGLTAIIAILGGHLYLNSQGLQEQIRQTNRKTAKVTVEANYLNAMEAQEKEVRRKKSLIEELNKKNPDVLSALTRFSGCVPEEVVLVKCELTPYSLNMQGRVTADFETASAIADSFKKCLERQSFRNVSITSLTLEQIVPQGAQETVALTGSKDRLFTLTAELGEPPVQAKAEKKSKKEQVEELMK
jgi:Tfp pilus assembly protein PilN